MKNEQKLNPFSRIYCGVNSLFWEFKQTKSKICFCFDKTSKQKFQSIRKTNTQNGSDSIRFVNQWQNEHAYSVS